MAHFIAVTLDALNYSKILNDKYLIGIGDKSILKF